MTISLTSSHVEAMSAEARRAYPAECCGLLVGTRRQGTVRVEQVIPVPNVWKGPRRNRYQLEPTALFRAERAARESGAEVVGFFHSHPDGQAIPSAFDAELAWPEYAYVIVPIDETDAAQPRCWVLPDEGQPFDEGSIVMRAG